MSMEQWWNDTDRGNWSAGRKTLYSVGGRWMDEYGAMVEWYWQAKTEVFGQKPALLPHYLQQISHRIPWDWTSSSMVRCQWPATWPMAHPTNCTNWH